MQHLHAPESDHFYVELFEAEHVMDIFKIEHDIIDTLSFASKISRSYRAQMVLSPSLHALVYQLCILFIKRRNPFHQRVG